jgi:hypothetical protein
MHRDPYTTWLIAQEQIQCFRQEKEKERLAQLAIASRPAKARLHRRVLAWIGRLLVAWGQRLRKRYALTSCITDCRPQPSNSEP